MALLWHHPCGDEVPKGRKAEAGSRTWRKARGQGFPACSFIGFGSPCSRDPCCRVYPKETETKSGGAWGGVLQLQDDGWRVNGYTASCRRKNYLIDRIYMVIRIDLGLCRLRTSPSADHIQVTRQGLTTLATARA